MSHRPWRDRLQDVLIAIEEIHAFTAGMDIEALRADAKTQKAVMADLALIGEAVRWLPEEVTSASTQIPWRAIADMRNLLIHAYFRIDLDIVWQTLVADVPALEREVRRLLTSP